MTEDANPTRGDVERLIEEADLKWLLRMLEREKYPGHCGEENSEIRARHDNDDRVDRVSSWVRQAADALQALTVENGALKTKLSATEKREGLALQIAWDTDDKNQAFSTKLGELEAGLRPFAVWFDAAFNDPPWTGTILSTYSGIKITIEDFRLVSRLISSPSGKE